MARSRGRSGDSSAILLAALAVLMILGWISEQPHWLQVVATVSVGVAGGAWLVLFWLEVDCNVPYKTEPGRCDVRVPGLLRACNRPGHKVWKRRALWARLLGRPEPARRQGPPSRSRPAYSLPPPTSADNPQWLMREVPYRAATLIVALVGTVAGIVAAAVDVYMIANL